MANSKNRCLGCRELVPVAELKQYPVGKFCKDKDCAIEYAFKPPPDNAQKVRKLRDKEHALMKKVVNDSSLTRQHGLTQKAFNKLRKLQEFKWFADRNIEPYCISCRKENMDWCCGHFQSAGHQGAIRYDEKNTYLQCNRHCNLALSSNREGNKYSCGYKKGLMLRFGAGDGSAIIEYCERDRIKKWECSELIEMRKAFSKEMKQLEIEL